jgi:DNA-binding response OmpR family regulator
MTRQPCVLVVEDEDSMLAGIEYALAREGYEVLTARDGEAALKLLAERAPDLVLLDLMLPRRSGYEVLQALRRDGRELPVIVVSARGEELDKVKGLDLGADDYVTKPFGLAELLARVRARLRRHARAEEALPDAFLLGELRVDLRARQVERPDGPQDLTVREVDMLVLLWRERGQPVSRRRFLDEVWGVDGFPTTRTIDQHVARLRQKLEPDPARPVHLLTVHGVGYKLAT